MKNLSFLFFCVVRWWGHWLKVASAICCVVWSERGQGVVGIEEIYIYSIWQKQKSRMLPRSSFYLTDDRGCVPRMYSLTEGPAECPQCRRRKQPLPKWADKSKEPLLSLPWMRSQLFIKDLSANSGSTYRRRNAMKPPTIWQSGQSGSNNCVPVKGKYCLNLLKLEVILKVFVILLTYLF